MKGLAGPAQADGKKLYDDFALYILPEANWTYENMMNLSIMCERSLCSGEYGFRYFKVACNDSPKPLFGIDWCRFFVTLLLPDQSTSDMTTDRFENVDTSVLDDGKLEFSKTQLAEIDIPLGIGENANQVPNSKLELCFHRNTTELCPVVNALFSPMAISMDHNGKIELCPYAVPSVNHRSQNLQLLKNLMNQTILNQDTSNHLADSTTILPFRMVADENETTGLLHGYNQLQSTGATLAGNPTAQLFHETKCDSSKTELELEFLLSVMLAEKVQQTDSIPGLPQPNASDIRKLIQDVRKHLQEEKLRQETGTAEPSATESGQRKRRVGNLNELNNLLVYSTCKNLVAMTLNTWMRHGVENNSSQVFCRLAVKLTSQVPSMGVFFPYLKTDRGKNTSRHQFHHCRFIIGAMTHVRDATIEGCHRNFSQILALMNFCLPGTEKKGKGLTSDDSGTIVKTSLFFESTTVIDILPSLPTHTKSNADTVSHLTKEFKIGKIFGTHLRKF